MPCAPPPYLSALSASPPDSERVPQLDRRSDSEAGERRAKRAAACPQARCRRLRSAPSPDRCRNSLGVGRVARRARLVVEPYSRPLPRLTLKAGRKAGLPTTPITVGLPDRRLRRVQHRLSRRWPLYKKTHMLSCCVLRYIRIYHSRSLERKKRSTEPFYRTCCLVRTHTFFSQTPQVF